MALDVGTQRIGVAVANLGVRFARPLTTLEQPDRFVDDICELVRQEDVAWVVIGLPRGMQGQDTAQTAQTQAFGDELQQRLASGNAPIPVYWTDEALTSARAEAEIRSRGNARKPYAHAKGDIDALAATYILEDFLIEQSKEHHG